MAKYFRPRFHEDLERWSRAINHLKEIGINDAEQLIFKAVDTKHEVQDKTTETHRDLSSRSTRIKTLEELLTHCQVDLTTYEVVSFAVNKWEVGAKEENGVETTELFQVKARLRKIKQGAVDVLQGIHREFLNQIKKGSPVPVPVIHKPKANCLLEPMIADIHIGKIAFDDEGNVIWDKQKAVEMYSHIIDDILNRINKKRISRILLPVGNDLLNIDSEHNTTFRGTPQMTGSTFHRLVADTELLLIRNIERLMTVAPVDVVCIPGNHDRMSVFHIGRTLKMYFHNNKNVNVQVSHNQRAYYQFKKCMVAFTHGNNEKIMNLPSIAAIENPVMWGKTKTREFHVGHFHHVQSKSFNAAQDTRRLNGMTVRVCPSVCPADMWHIMKGYIDGLRRTQTFVFSPEHLNDILHTNI